MDNSPLLQMLLNRLQGRNANRYSNKARPLIQRSLSGGSPRPQGPVSQKWAEEAAAKGLPPWVQQQGPVGQKWTEEAAAKGLPFSVQQQGPVSQQWAEEAAAAKATSPSIPPSPFPAFPSLPSSGYLPWRQAALAQPPQKKNLYGEDDQSYFADPDYLNPWTE